MARNDSALALSWTLERYSESSGPWVFLWTFTFPDETDVRECGKRWSTLWNRMQKAFPALSMVRVFEPHPRGHGWHVHAVTDKRLWVVRVRAMAEDCGFGRIHVKRIPSKKAGYVAKYLGKSQEKARAGVPLWMVCGKARCVGRYTRVSDVETESSLSDLFRKVRLNMRSFDGWQAVKARCEKIRTWLAEEGYLVPHWLDAWEEIPWRQAAREVGVFVFP